MGFRPLVLCVVSSRIERGGRGLVAAIARTIRVETGYLQCASRNNSFSCDGVAVLQEGPQTASWYMMGIVELKMEKSALWLSKEDVAETVSLAQAIEAL
ncbi:hypothetical protein SAMN05216344_10551 [Polaromonas sp. OV174]|nr:hypothetical protein SAMN05216344_10551 [Polaromonas sp. OV174]